MRRSPGFRRLRLLPLLAAAAAAISLTGCGSGQEVVAGVREPTIRGLQEFVDQNWDEPTEADAPEKEQLADRARRERQLVGSEEEELETAAQPEAEGSG